MTEARTVASIAGRNARNHRRQHSATLDDVAQAARRLGLRWSAGKVGDFEGGRVSPTVPTLFTVCAALGEATGSSVSLAQLLDAQTPVEVNESLIVPATAFREAFSSEPVTVRSMSAADNSQRATSLLESLRDLPEWAGELDAQVWRRVEAGSGDAELKLARSLGVPPVHVVAASALLWGRSLTQERDRRAGDGANAQRRGIISRTLGNEIRTVLNGDD